MQLQPKSNEGWKVKVRDWWYELEEECSEMMHSQPELRRAILEDIIKEALAQKDAEVAEAREEMVGHGYRMAVRHLKEAYKHNGATTVPEAIDWLEDNARLFPTPKD